VPRLINLTADRALLAGYTAQARSVGVEHVKQALASLQGEEGIDPSAATAPRLLSNPRRRWVWWTGGAAAASLVLAAGLWFGMDGRAELLAWRAARSPSTAEAERMYAAIARDHGASRHRENALLRLAQLQVARGSFDEAVRSIESLSRDYPAGWAIGEGRYWGARALFAKGDTAAACVATRAVPAAAAGTVASDLSIMTSSCDAFTAQRALEDTSANAMATADTARPIAPVQPAGSATPEGSSP
jgi:hypothetical protein